MVTTPNCTTFCFILKGKQPQMYEFGTSCGENESVRKKGDLLLNFKKYLQQKSDAKQSYFQRPESISEAALGTVYLKKWVKSSRGVVFCLSSKLVQVQFEDGAELMVDSGSKTTTLVNGQGETVTMPSSEVGKSKNKDLLKRIKYTKEALAKKDKVVQ